MNIPHPDNPNHVENLRTLALLEAQGFEGPYACLEISLSEYHLAWRDLGDRILFVYRNEHGTFERNDYAKTTDATKEWDWAMKDGFLSSIGITLEEFRRIPLTEQVHLLYVYYGAEEIFGTTYWQGFKIYKETEL